MMIDTARGPRGFSPAAVHAAGPRLYLLAALLLIAGCGDEGSRPVGFNVVVITLDTLRADHVSCYGSDKVATPHLDEIAASGTLFLNATASAPLTLPSHTSLFTGTHPPTHGVRDNMGFILPGEALTLAELLQDRGWRTSGFVSAYVLNAGLGIAQGFDHFYDDFTVKKGANLSPGNIQRPGEETMDKALAWLEENGDDPFFLWVHLFDPHTPYQPPEPYASRYPGNPYAGEVARTDALVGRLNRKLEETGLEDSTVVVVVGDHGEGRGDHQESYHGIFVYDTTLQVPFIIRAPGFTPRQVAAQVRLIDLMPTVLELLGLPLPDALPARSLAPLMTGDRDDLNLAAYSESFYPLHHYGWSELKSLRAGKYKYIQGPTPELFDLSADPKEARNLARDLPDVLSRMEKNLQEIEKRALAIALGSARMGEVDSESAEALRLLGYTGTFVADGTRSGEKRPDPKDKAALILDIEAAQGFLAEGKNREAIPRLEAVVARDPSLIDARISLGIAQCRVHEYGKGAAIFREIVEMDPDLHAAWINLGSALIRDGRVGEAIRIYKKAIELKPEKTDTREALINLYFKMGQVKKAETLCKELLAMAPQAVEARVALAQSLVMRGKWKDGEEELNLALDRSAENIHYLQGKILANRGDLEEAAKAFEAELARYTANTDAYKSLAEVYQRLDRGSRAVEILEAAVESNPRDFDCHLMLIQAYVKEKIAHNKALARAKKTVELDPSSQEAWDAFNALHGLKEK